MLCRYEFFGRSILVQLGKGFTAASQTYPRRCGFAGTSRPSEGDEVDCRIRQSWMLAR
jgi:hypothetical protein